MSNFFNISDVVYISTVIKDLFYMSEKELFFDICVDATHSGCEFIQFKFFLNNGLTKINVSNEYGNIHYYDSNENELKWIQFRREQLTDTTGSFHKALKQVLVFDRQNTIKSNDNNIAIDRASFGLSKEN